MSVTIHKASPRRLGLLAMFAAAATLGAFVLWAGHLWDRSANSTASAELGARRPVSDDDRYSDRPPPLKEALTVSAFLASFPSDAGPEQLDVRKHLAKGGDPVFNPDMEHLLEQLVSRAFSLGASHDEVEGVVAQALGCCVPESHQAQAREALRRYMQYRKASLALQLPGEVRESSLDSMKWIQAERKRLQGEFFLQKQGNGLFGDSNHLSDYFIARQEILRNPQLNEQAQQRALSEVEASMLPDDLRTQVREFGAINEVVEQNRTVSNPEDRYRVRAEAFGEDAAKRMAEVDAQIKQWNAKVESYAAASPAEQAVLRDSMFTPAEQKRLEGAVSLLKQR